MFTTLNIKLFIKQYWIIIFLTLVGAFLRLYNIKPTISFLGDQGRDVRIVRDLLQKADPILVGPTTSVGKIQLGPLYYYYMAPWLWLFNFDPVGPAVGVAIIGIITIPIFYFALKRMFGGALPTIATTLYTFSVVVIQNTRTSWNPNPMPLFAILLIYSLYQAYEHKSGKHLTLSFLWLSIALQLHYMIMLIIPMYALIIFLIMRQFKDKRKFLKSIFYGISIGLLFLLPLIVFDFRHQFLNTKGFLEFFQKGHHSPQEWFQPILDMEGRIHTSIGNLLGFNNFRSLRNPFAILIFIATLIYGYFYRKNKAVQIVLLYCLFSLIGMSLYRGDLFDHYLGFFFPIPFILVALLLNELIKQFRIIGIIVTFVIITFVTISQTKQYNILKPLGWQIDNIHKLANDISSDAKEPYNIILLDDTKDYPGMNYRYYLEMNQNPPANELNYGGIKTLYLISQYQDLANVNLESRQLEAFFNTRINNLQDPNDTAIITEKIVKSWDYIGGPWVYKIVK